MNFSERLRKARESKNMTQEELAKKSGITTRSIQRYEEGTNRPRMAQAEKLAAALEISIDSLLGNQEKLIIEAQEKGGTKAARDVASLVSEVTGLFAGGDIDDEEKDGIMEALNRAYWDSKMKNKAKYTPKKYRKKNDDEAQ